MNMPEDNIARPQRRLRRPKPERTEPRRNILGAFFQGGEENRRPAPPPSQPNVTPERHPLGLQTDDQPEPPHSSLTSSQNQEDIQAAANVIDRHIRDGEKHSISMDASAWSRLSSLAGQIDTAEIAEIAKTLTRSYSEVAAVWIELAGKLRETLGQRGEAPAAPAQNHPSPMVCIQSPLRLTAKAEMFQPDVAHSVQPLQAQAPCSAAPLTDVSLDAGQINLRVPGDTPPGSYHGLILSDEGRPLGAISLTVPEAAAS